MFMDTSGGGPEPWPERDSEPRRLTVGEQKTLYWLAGINIVLLLVAPIGGATLFDLMFSLLR